MAWADNSQVGLFVQRVCRAALDKACSCSAFAGLIVRKPGGGTCLMVDQGKHAAGQLPRASLLPWLGAVIWGRPPSRQGRRLRGALLGSVALGSLLLPSLLDPSRKVLSQPLPQPEGAQPAAACWDDLRPAGPRPCAGVYTRNRAFRLLLSSKFGKEACLAPTGRWGDRHMTMQQLFFASLVTHLPEDAAASQLLDGASTSRPGSACGVHRQRTMRHHTGQPTLLHMAPAAACDAACRASSGGAAAAAGLPAAWQHLLLAWPSVAAAAGAAGAPTAASSAGPAPAGASAGGAGGSGQALAPGAPMCPALPGPSPYASLEAFITSQCNQVRRRAWGAAAGFQEGLLMQLPGRGGVLNAFSGPDCLHQCRCLHCCRAASRGG
jgi:hypothetical protein